ncbi:serine hydroxymethyltransferase [Prochlorococcus sp. MIT 1223]|uniref:serine hydroxymethyltransferase n=1 Tax=Prochlorococcus sp. MIT 1223 TaxID=3096217 RepID=UPI002A74C7B7|nr:serine hydroxymethyltransferase [Prochlorococcus sp. MIT 1223]
MLELIINDSPYQLIKMEFLLFLKPNEIEILNIMQKIDYKVEENTPLCLIGDQYFGFLKHKQRRIVICTNNAKVKGGYSFSNQSQYEGFNKTGIYIRRALRHEAVHVAQHCNNGDLINIETKRKMKIHPYKLDSLKGSTRISGKREHEYQAYMIEDKPKIIIKALRKYCL